MRQVKTKLEERDSVIHEGLYSIIKIVDEYSDPVYIVGSIVTSVRTGNKFATGVLFYDLTEAAEHAFKCEQGAAKEIAKNHEKGFE
jgi:hypothetical protein